MSFSNLFAAESKPIEVESIERYKKYFPLLSNEQWNSIASYATILIDWNSRVNIISRKDIHNIMKNHIIPSLSMSLVCEFRANDTIIDVGTGGGLPGIPLAIAFPSSHFTLLDSNSKKIAIVSDVIQQLKLNNVRTIWSRAEAVEQKFDHITGRAVSAIPSFLDFSSHLMRNNDIMSDRRRGLWYLKGGEFIDELKEAKIQSYALTKVKDLVDVDSDKSVMYIPSSEIISFNKKKKKS